MKRLIFIIIVACLLFSSACKEEGCMDINATNYNVDAKKDDGSCVYPPEEDNFLVGVWISKDTCYDGTYCDTFNFINNSEVNIVGLARYQDSQEYKLNADSTISFFINNSDIPHPFNQISDSCISIEYMILSGTTGAQFPIYLRKIN